jgi:hypothetical protein
LIHVPFCRGFVPQAGHHRWSDLSVGYLRHSRAGSLAWLLHFMLLLRFALVVPSQRNLLFSTPCLFALFCRRSIVLCVTSTCALGRAFWLFTLLQVLPHFKRCHNSEIKFCAWRTLTKCPLWLLATRHVPAVAACIFVVSSVLDADFNPCPPPTTIDVRVTNVFCSVISLIIVRFRTWRGVTLRKALGCHSLSHQPRVA